MASFAPIRGTRAQIQATPIVDGQFLIETDQGVDNMIYIDEGSTRTIVGGNTISGVLPELYIYSETGSVVTVKDAGGNVIPTSQVGTDHWTCELPDYGVYTITSVLSGETTTQSIDVNDCMIYTIDASHFHVNIVVTYPSGVGASCQISGGGETYSAPALNPPNTSYKFVVHGKNTTYTITTTVDGATKTATVTTGTTIDQTYEVTMSYGQINLTVETPPITGDITCTDGVTTIIKPASANMVFYVPNTGTWDISGSDGSITYSTRAIVTSLSTPVSAGLNTGLDLASWITAGSTTEYPLNPSSYADFSALEADEAAIRQLMLVHDAVDYLATAPAGDNLMQNVINSDICAKWINLSDYALDTLSANSDIKSVMDTADKYGYGEWGKVEIASKGTASASAGASGYEAYHAFTPIGSDAGWYISGAAYTNAWLKCDLGAKTKVTDVITYIQSTDGTPTMTITFSGSDDDITYTPIKTGMVVHATKEITALDAPVDYRYYKWEITAFTGSSSNTSGFKANLLSWGALGCVPIMTADNAPYGTAFGTTPISTSYAAWKAFNGTNTDYHDGWYVAASTGQLGYESVSPICVKEIMIQNRLGGYGAAAIKDFTLQGYDGTQWVTIGTFTNQNSEEGETSRFKVANNNAYYMKHQINVTSGHGSEIAVAQLQFYGRELTPLVPTMTADDKPKGTVSCSDEWSSNPAWKAFDNNASTGWWSNSPSTPQSVAYEFENANKVCMASVKQSATTDLSYTNNVVLQYDNNGTMTDIGGTSYSITVSSTSTKIDTVKPFTGIVTDKVGLKASYASGNNYLIVVNELQFYGSDYSEKEFAQGSTRKTIYDHGLELVELDTSVVTGGASVVKEPNQFVCHLVTGGQNTYLVVNKNAILINQDNLYMKLGNMAYRSDSSAQCGSLSIFDSKVWTYNDDSHRKGYTFIPKQSTDTIVYSLDISTFKQSQMYVGFSDSTSGANTNLSCTELWLE